MPTQCTPVPSAKVQELVIKLEAIGDRLEAAGKPEWVTVAQAAALLEGIRLGITQIATDAPPDHWFGIDLSTGPDRTVTNPRGRHA